MTGRCMKLLFFLKKKHETWHNDSMEVGGHFWDGSPAGICPWRLPWQPSMFNPSKFWKSSKTHCRTSILAILTMFFAHFYKVARLTSICSLVKLGTSEFFTKSRKTAIFYLNVLYDFSMLTILMQFLHIGDSY